MKVIIVGGGKTGSHVAAMLLKSGCAVKIIDYREEVLEKLHLELPADTIVHGSGTDPNILEACGIGGADVVAAVTGNDESNLVVSTMAKFVFGVPRVIARVNNPKNAWLFGTEMGVDAALNEADLMSRLIVEEMALKKIFNLLELNRNDYSIIQTVADAQSAAVGRPVREFDIPGNLLLIAVFRGNDVIIPHGATVIQAEDQILAFGNSDSHATLSALFSA